LYSIIALGVLILLQLRIDVTDDCDGCISVCPKNAIAETAMDKSKAYATIDKYCIYCCACIKACPPPRPEF
jgi:ferredoxin